MISAVAAESLVNQGLINMVKCNALYFCQKKTLKELLFRLAARYNCCNLNTAAASLFVSLFTFLGIFDGLRVVSPEVRGSLTTSGLP